jgi:flagellar export protein FliJ
MAGSRAMRRLLRVLELQEEQCRAQMETALADLKRLERDLATEGNREREGRRLVTASAESGELLHRLVGLEESRLAEKRIGALRPRIVEAEEVTGSRRSRFLEKRIERRQAETVVQTAEATHEMDAGRRSQRVLDDWFLRRVK